MIALYTDFGLNDPYVGQVKAKLAACAPGHTVIDLLHQSPDFDALAGAHLLSALAGHVPHGTVCLAVVDPGVGTPRDAVVMMAQGRWFVGPDNGLLSVLAARARDVQCWRIAWQPAHAAASFHGRDLFAPIAAEIATGNFPVHKLAMIAGLTVQFDAHDLARVIYIDHYGNAWTGMRSVPAGARVWAGGQPFRHSETFGFVAQGQGFWFMNSVGLLELAVNRGSAEHTFGLKLGDPVEVHLSNMAR